MSLRAFDVLTLSLISSDLSKCFAKFNCASVFRSSFSQKLSVGLRPSGDHLESRYL